MATMPDIVTWGRYGSKPALTAANRMAACDTTRKLLTQFAATR